MVRPTNDRIVLVLVIGLGLLGIIWVRCVVLQVVDPHHYAAMAAAQRRAVSTFERTYSRVRGSPGVMYAFWLGWNCRSVRSASRPEGRRFQ